MTRTTTVPDDVQPEICPYCERPLPDTEAVTLHKGLEHWDDLSDDERDAFRTTYDNEQSDLRRFQLQAMLALILIYFAFLFTYSIVT